MAAKLDDVFTNAADLRQKKEQEIAAHKAACQAVVDGPARETIALLENVKAAADRVIKETPFFSRWTEAGNFYLDIKKDKPSAIDGVYQAHCRLEQKTYQGLGLDFAFREDGTMKVDYARHVNNQVENYDMRELLYTGPIDTAKAGELLAGYLKEIFTGDELKKLRDVSSQLTASAAKPAGPQPQ